MTPDEKRSHLRLCGCEATRYAVFSNTASAWRIYRLPLTYGARCLSARAAYYKWQPGSLTTADRYTQDTLDTVPDELLDLLDLSLLEHILTTD